MIGADHGPTTWLPTPDRPALLPPAWQPILRALGDGSARPWSQFCRDVPDPIAREALTRAIAGTQLLERAAGVQ